MATFEEEYKKYRPRGQEQTEKMFGGRYNGINT